MTDERKDDYCHGPCDGDGRVAVHKDDENNERVAWHDLWLAAEAKGPAKNGYYLVPCPICGGTGKRGRKMQDHHIGDILFAVYERTRVDSCFHKYIVYCVKIIAIEYQHSIEADDTLSYPIYMCADNVNNLGDIFYFTHLFKTQEEAYAKCRELHVLNNVRPGRAEKE